MITGINESTTVTKHISCGCICIFDSRKSNSDQWCNKNKYLCQCKKHISEKDYTWNPATSSCKNEKYLASIIDDSVITCDELIDANAKSYKEETKTIPRNFNEKKTCLQNTKFFYFTCLPINYHCIIDSC